MTPPSRSSVSLRWARKVENRYISLYIFVLYWFSSCSWDSWLSLGQTKITLDCNSHINSFADFRMLILYLFIDFYFIFPSWRNMFPVCSVWFQRKCKEIMKITILILDFSVRGKETRNASNQMSILQLFGLVELIWTWHCLENRVTRKFNVGSVGKMDNSVVNSSNALKIQDYSSVWLMENMVWLRWEFLNYWSRIWDLKDSIKARDLLLTCLLRSFWIVSLTWIDISGWWDGQDSQPFSILLCLFFSWLDQFSFW